MSDITLTKEEENYSLIIDGISIGSAWVGLTDLVPEKEFMNKTSKVIMEVFIQDDYRGKGFGQTLISKIIESEKSKGTEYLRLGVLKDNEPAIKIYEKAGFIKDGLIYDHMHYMWIKL